MEFDLVALTLNKLDQKYPSKDNHQAFLYSSKYIKF